MPTELDEVIVSDVRDKFDSYDSNWRIKTCQT